jgi:CelD/BcsL family acetyltransferase involved in cellulose biosynthesis
MPTMLRQTGIDALGRDAAGGAACAESPHAAAAVETALPMRIGSRTFWTLRRRLVRRRLSLDEALSGEAFRLPALGESDDGYLISGLPAAGMDGVAASAEGLRPFVRQRYRRSYARLDRGFDDYLGKFSAKSRSTLKRKLKRLADRSGGALDVRFYGSEAEMEIFHPLARSVSEKTYQERLLGAGLPDGEEALAEMRTLARAGLARAWLLFVEGRPVSYLYTPAEGATLVYAHLGYDPDFADFSPGAVLQLEAMRRLMEEGAFKLFDFTEGDGEHKRRFATGSLDCVDLLLLRPTARNLVAGHALNGFDRAVAVAKAAVLKLGGKGLVRRLRR